MEIIKQIIGMGGGGFTMEPNNLLLDNYILEQSPKEKPRICFLPTASGDIPEYIGMFYDSFNPRPCIPTHLSVTDPETHDFENFLLEQDIIYVGGGHTGRMLELWKHTGLDIILKKAWEQGIVLAGLSSGTACWFEEALTDSTPGKLTPEKCLGFLKGSSCSHYDNPVRRPTFLKLIRIGKMRNGIGVDNFAAIHFIGSELKHVVSSRPRAAAYTVRYEKGHSIEKQLESRYLGEMHS